MTTNQSDICSGAEARIVAADLYGEAAALLNAFFARHTFRYCADCLAFHRNCAPEDAISNHRLEDGVFPGCCQEGVADDSRIPFGSGKKLPASLIEEIRARRPARPSGHTARYSVRDLRDGKVYHGSGCLWLGEEGCTLGPWKSTLCLSYLCQPVLDALSEEIGAILPEDFCSIAEAFIAIGRAAGGGAGFLEEAKRSIALLRGNLTELEAEISLRRRSGG